MADAMEPKTPSTKSGTNLLFVLKMIVPIAIVIASLAGYGYLKNSKPLPSKPKLVEKTWPVQTIKAKASTVTPTLNLYGNTVSGRQVEIRALVAGKIIETGPALKEGALVKKGEMLLAIDDFDYKGATREAQAFLEEAIARQAELRAAVMLEQENLKFAKAQLLLAQKDYQRAAGLSKRGTVTKKLADDRKVIVSQRAQMVSTHKVNLELQRARLKGQKAVIERLSWKVDQAKRRLEETKLIAPFDAYVSSVSAEIGRTVGANDRIATLIDAQEIDVRFVLTDAQYGRILDYEKTLIGRKISLSWKVGEKPITYQATIKRIGAEIASQTGGVEIYAAITEAKDLQTLRTGAFVEVKVKDREYKNVYQLPQTAIYNGNTIFLVVNNRLKPILVTIVGTAGSDSLIRADLPDGAEILSSRLTLAGEGVKVKPHGTNNTGSKKDQLSNVPPQKKGKSTKTAEGL